MKALILAGGHGTRMHPLTLRTPKSLLPIAGKPNILHIIDSLTDAGINDIYVSINESQLKVNDFLKDKKVNIIIENQDKGKLGSIGGLNYAINKIGFDDLLVIGADNFFMGLDFKELINFVKQGSATIVLYELPDKLLVENYGIAVMNDDLITSFQEKPRVSEAKSKLASTLVYALSSDWIKHKLPEYVKNNTNLDTIGSMWQYFCDKDKLYGFVFNGLWADIGNPRAYVELNKKVLNSRFISDKAVIGSGSVIKGNVIIEDGCVIGRNCVISNSHLMHDSTIGEGSVINGSIVFENAHIGRHSTVNNSVIDGLSVIGNNVSINDYCVTGYNSVINNDSRLLRNSRVWPYLKASGVIDGDVVYLKDASDLKNSRYWVM